MDLSRHQIQLLREDGVSALYPPVARDVLGKEASPGAAKSTP